MSYQKLLQKFPAIQTDIALAPLTSMNIGGSADLYYKLTDINQLPALIDLAYQLQLPVFMLGGGSNTIFADEGFRGLVVHMQPHHLEIDHTENNPEFGYIIADAGTLLSQVVQFSLKNNLSGLEKMMGLPGTIGGAVRGNAGAFGVEIQDIFSKALIYTPEKGLHEEPKAYFNFNYRFSTVKKSQDIILKVFLKLAKKDAEASKTALAEALAIVKNRISKQPKGKCSGSFFKNPDPHNDLLKAGYLLDQVGCKGLQIGQAQVSLAHANWIMNLGGATQKDVLELKNIMQERVKSRFNISLEPEVQFVTATGFLQI